MVRLPVFELLKGKEAKPVKKAILVFIALVIVSLSVWANEPSFSDDGNYHYYQIVGLRLDKTGIEGVKELNRIRLIIDANTAPSDISRWRLVTGQDPSVWPEISIFGSSIEVVSSKKENNCLIVDLKPTLEIQSDLKINLEEIQIVLEKKTDQEWKEVKKINLKIKEVEESNPRFLP